MKKKKKNETKIYLALFLLKLIYGFLYYAVKDKKKKTNNFLQGFLVWSTFDLDRQASAANGDLLDFYCELKIKENKK